KNLNLNKFNSIPVSNLSPENIFSNNNELFFEKTIQMDYSQVYHHLQFEFGGKIINRKNESDYLYQSFDINGSVIPMIEDPSNNFKYDQSIYAGYASMNLNWKRTFLRMGSRMEKTSMAANFISENTLAKQEYFNVIPNISFGFPIKNAGNISMSWNQRLERPGIFYLNPFVYVIDSRTIEYGNPNLNPALSNQVSLQYSMFHKSTSFFLSLYESFARNGIQRITTLKDSVTHISYDNIGSQSSAGVQGTLNMLAFKRLSFGLSGSINHTRYSAIAGTSPISGFYYSYAANAAIRFNHSLRFNASTGFTSGRVNAQGKSSGFANSTLTINKDFGENKKFSINLSCQNPWTSSRTTLSDIRNAAFILQRENIMNVRRLNLTFNYRFGQYNGKIARKRKSIQNDDLLNGDKSSD
ncbi:MAG: outer membrane beta-barrel family protein, partial [Chitinophagaceae bacterium]